MYFTNRQEEVLKDIDHRWNVFIGAVRSGKSYLTMFILLLRLDIFDKKHKLLLGATSVGKIEDNILYPMRMIYGENRVSKIVSGTAKDVSHAFIFGRRFDCVGHSDKGSQKKIHGSEYAYALIDEGVLMHETFFNMLKSRLSVKGAICDITANPDTPNHFLKKFIDSAEDKGVDVKEHKFVIDDNTYLDEGYVSNLKKEYEGTVLYDRFIRGLWTAGSGAIYKPFLKQTERHLVGDEIKKNIAYCRIGLDFGKSKSNTSLKLTGFLNNMTGAVVLKEMDVTEHFDVKLMVKYVIEFTKECIAEYPRTHEMACDNAEPEYINEIQGEMDKLGIPMDVYGAKKREIKDRIAGVIILFNYGALKVHRDCKNMIKAIMEAVYDETKQDDERLDDGRTSDIDSLDAMEYSLEQDLDTLLDVARYRNIN